MHSLNPHGKTHISSFVELVRDRLGISISVVDESGKPASPDATIASVREDRSEGGELSLSDSLSVEQACKAFFDQLGLRVRILDRDGKVASGDSSLKSTGFLLTESIKAAGPEDASTSIQRSSAISITGQKKIATLQREFNEHHPYLGLMLFTSEEYAKSAKGEAIRPISGEFTIASVREKKSTEELSIHGNMLVKTLESRIRDVYGLYAQVCIMTDQGRRAYTGESHDDYSLSELNKRQQSKGRMTFR
jgi:hypothetical protein